MRLYTIHSPLATTKQKHSNPFAKISKKAYGATHAVRVASTPPGLFSFAHPEWLQKMGICRNQKIALNPSKLHRSEVGGGDFVFEVSTSTLESELACFGCKLFANADKR